MPWFVALSLVLAALSGQDDTPLSPADGDALDVALTEILHNVAAASEAAAQGTPREPTEVIVTERAVNGYLRFQGASLMPPGIIDPTVRMVDDGRVMVDAIVNLDEVREQEERGVLDPLRYLSGTLPVHTVARVVTEERAMHIHVETAEVGSVAVPRAVLLELIRHYTRTNRRPDGVDLSAPIRLPYGIEAVRVEAGRTVVVQ